MIRGLLENLSKGIVLRRKMPKSFEGRTIFVSPEGGGLRYWKLNTDTIDHMLLATVDRFVKPGATVWDVGGNVGFFALSSAVRSKTGKVIVFEPDPFLQTMLRRTADANSDLKIDILPFAVSDKPGLVRLNIANRARSANFIEGALPSTQTGGVARSVLVPSVNLDTVLEWCERPDVVKIDVEGAEIAVLKGMDKLLRTVRPIVLCEVMDETKYFVDPFFKERGYKLFDATKLPNFVEDLRTTDNYIALPE